MLSELAQPEPYIRKLNKLRLDKHWIEKVSEGQEVRVQYDEWENKSLPRYQLRILYNGKTQSWPFVYGPGMTIEDALGYYLPWADFEMDLEAHRDAAGSDWEANCYCGHDSETGIAYYSETFDEWYKEPNEISPINSDGEIETYSLVLSLNELGRSFLELDSYLSDSNIFEKVTFTLDT